MKSTSTWPPSSRWNVPGDSELKLKWLHPVAFEVDGVGEHEVCGGVDVVGGDHGVDEVVRGLLHPLVDHLHSGLGLRVPRNVLLVNVRDGSQYICVRKCKVVK